MIIIKPNNLHYTQKNTRHHAHMVFSPQAYCASAAYPKKVQKIDK